MKEGFYLREHPVYGVILYEYRYGILSYYNNMVTWSEENKLEQYYFPEYGWFLSKRNYNDSRIKLEFLEDL